VLFSHISACLMLSCNRCFPAFIIFSHSPSRKMGRDFIQFFRYCYKKPRQHSIFTNTVLYTCIQHTALLTPLQHPMKQVRGGEFLHSSGRVTELKWLRKEHDVVAFHTEYSHFFPLSYSFWTALP
jgi:hypothetical protein